ncbi:MAG: extracellular solute-binding protein [Eubacteriales bacterium]
MKKKGIVLILILILCIITFTTCILNHYVSFFSLSNEQSNHELIEISISLWDIENALSGGENDLALQRLQDMFHIKLVPMNVTWDDFQQKIPLWAASGTLPDVFTLDIIGSATYYDWIDTGIIQGLPTDLSHYPNLAEYVNSEDFDFPYKVDGQIFSIPRKSYPDIESTSVGRVLFYRWDLAQAVGITEEPETYQDFVDMMVRIIAADPEDKNIQGLTSTQASLLNSFLFNYSIPGGELQGTTYRWTKQEDGTFLPSYFAGDMMATFQLARDMYQSGAIEPNIATNTTQQSNELFLQGKCAAILRSGGAIGAYNDYGRYWEEIYPGQDFLEDVRLLPLLESIDGNRYYNFANVAYSETYISSSVSAEKLDRILQLYDFLATDEGYQLVNYGLEGVDFEVVDGYVQLLVEYDDILAKYPLCASGNSLLEWGRAGWDETVPGKTPEEYRQMNIARKEEAVTIGILPSHDLRYSYLNLPLKNDLFFTTPDDLLTIMISTEPVETMVNQLLADYESKGLSAVIHEVNQAATELGWQ